ncbi:MAG: GNAT family N-acetyltransferase [Hyphomonas sp.]
MIVLRPATLDDVPLPDLWDLETEVISATSDDPDAPRAFGDTYGPDKSALVRHDDLYFIAALDGRPIAGLQIIDPHTEPTHDWGNIEPHLRAIDIWICNAADRGQGFGRQAMRLAIEVCFRDPDVKAIIIDPLVSNMRAHTFYQRLGFRPEGIRERSEDDDVCLVHRLTLEDWRKIFPGE